MESWYVMEALPYLAEENVLLKGSLYDKYLCMVGLKK